VPELCPEGACESRADRSMGHTAAVVIIRGVDTTGRVWPRRNEGPLPAFVGGDRTTGSERDRREPRNPVEFSPATRRPLVLS